jgi:hypothetical protein
MTRLSPLKVNVESIFNPLSMWSALYKKYVLAFLKDID